MPVQRADARRNYARLLTVAKEAIAAEGPDASLEQIARIAGVGSATLRRHFPSRQALLEAVFRERVETLCAHARERTGRADTRAALLEWLSAVLADAATIRGLATALTRDRATGPDTAHEHCCSEQLTEAGEPLVRRAADEGALAPGVTIDDLLALITGIALATEHHPDPAAEAHRLLGLAIAGVSPHQG
ncbi:TetR/AcrR family transcriptional regulator [Microbispora sp. NPDC046933]|uniref:TetR/AcrR family transcriptional regulator n=1 Tax=Microbispora sp. NPDC046933 TaxID=3155618 RepID=UPI0033C44A98